MIVLYYQDEFDNQHRVPLGNYSMNDAQALINLALERKQTVSFILGGHEYVLDMRTAQRTIVLEESYEQEILDRVAEADAAAELEAFEVEGDDDDGPYDPDEDDELGPFA